MGMALTLTTGIIVAASARTVFKSWRRRNQRPSWLHTQPDAVLSAPSPSDPIPEAVPVTIVLDRLEQIAGFEPRYARRLNQAGVLTYREMAGLSPAALQSIVAPNGPFNLPIDQWQTQAQRLAEELVEGAETL
jgi:predicted flap endonuclease-1-like 5' DNA nuclease